MHNLTYPSQLIDVNNNGEILSVPSLGSGDLFRGPKELYTLGDPNNLPLITAYGQDNSGIYIDGDNITINDLNLKNCDLGSSLSFLDTVGSVIDVNGDNNTIKNSRISNGKNVIRSFSSNNLVIDNSLLSNALNFLFVTGSNEYIKHDELKEYSFIDSNGRTVNSSLKGFLNKQEEGDKILNSFLSGDYKDIDLMKKELMAIQASLNPVDKIDGFRGSTVINDTYFYHSGLSAIAFETLFNGPFLYSKSPSLIEDLFSGASMGNKPIAPYICENPTGLSYPVSVNVTGKSKFYDYKNPNEIDLSGLLDENISKIASEVTGSEHHITIDEVFPVKSLLIAEAKKNNINNASSSLNLIASFYGGASNLSRLSLDGLELGFNSVSLDVDFLDEYLKLQNSSDNLMSVIKDVMVKCVTVVTGFEPFKFVTVNGDYLSGEAPSLDDLINNSKGV